VLRALRRRHRLRIGLVQLIYMGCAVALAFAMPEIGAGPNVDSEQISTLLVSCAGGLIALITVVFSLLFLVVPYANTTLTPRLTLFRNDPMVWHSFAFLLSVFVFFAVCGITLSNDDDVSFWVPTLALVLVLASLGVFRALQMRAYRPLGLGVTLMDITEAGHRVIDSLYLDPIGDDRPVRHELPGVTTELRWPHGLCLVSQIDVPKLVQMASEADAVIEVRVGVGAELRRDLPLFSIRGGSRTLDEDDLRRQVVTGADRTFDQDPLFAFRLLADIAMRALSPAVNDPLTAVQAIGGVHDLLHTLVDRDLDIGRVVDAHETVRVVLLVPTWDDYLAIGVDELVTYVSAGPQSRRRLADMVEALLAEAPPSRRASLELRRFDIATLAPRLPAVGP